MSDIELVTMAKAAKDDAAFSVLVRRHQARLRAFLYRLCAENALADDIAQDTFMKAHAALASFKGGGSFRSWLFAIAYREFLQDRRKAKAKNRLENALKAEAAYQPSADQKLEETMSIDLQRALLTLEEKERAALLLCDAAGLSHTEASIALATPLGSIKTYIARGRQKMRDALSAQKETINKKQSVVPLNGASYAV